VVENGIGHGEFPGGWCTIGEGDKCETHGHHEFLKVLALDGAVFDFVHEIVHFLVFWVFSSF